MTERSASDACQDVVKQLVDFADTYDPGPNEILREIIDQARKALAESQQGQQQG